MADYHIIEGDKGGDNYRVVFHIIVPDETNRAGTINLHAALAEDTMISKPSIIPWIDPIEQASLDSGQIIEYAESFRPNEGDTPLMNRQKLDARFRELVATVQKFLRIRYAFWRFSRNVPNG